MMLHVGEKVACEYEVNPLAKDKVITEIQNLNAT